MLSVESSAITLSSRDTGKLAHTTFLERTNHKSDVGLSGDKLFLTAPPGVERDLLNAKTSKR